MIQASLGVYTKYIIITLQNKPLDGEQTGVTVLDRHHTHKIHNYRPEWPTITITWCGSKYKVYNSIKVISSKSFLKIKFCLQTKWSKYAYSVLFLGSFVPLKGIPSKEASWPENEHIFFSAGFQWNGCSVDSYTTEVPFFFFFCFEFEPLTVQSCWFALPW